MYQPRRQPKLRLVSKSTADRRTEPRTRVQPVPARLSDLYRERLPADVLNVSSWGLGIKSSEPFKVNFPVLIECGELLIVANVRHCLEATGGGYLLGLEVHRAIEKSGRELVKAEASLLTRLAPETRVRGAC